METKNQIDNPKYRKVKNFLLHKLEKINSKNCKIKKLCDGEPGEDLYIITGLNSNNDFESWNYKSLGFRGNIYGVEWNNNWTGWELIKNGSKSEIINNLLEFVLGYLKVCSNANDAGYYLANHLNEGSHNFIISHSMGTRAAFSFLKYYRGENTNNQILLLNGAAPSSKSLYNFSNYSSIAQKGIINFYNPSDPVLAILALIRVPLSKVIQNLDLLNEIYIEEFFNPIGLEKSLTIPHNFNLSEILGVDHSINVFIDQVLIYNGVEKRFIFKAKQE